MRAILLAAVLIAGCATPAALAGCASIPRPPSCEADLYGAGAVTLRCEDGRPFRVACERPCQFTAPCKLASVTIQSDPPVTRTAEDYPRGMPKSFCVYRVP